ncbi:MAG: hypothetical protein WD295_02105, partial [Bacteroidota bacterium]
NAYPVAWLGPGVGADSSIHLGFVRALKLHEPFVVRFNIEGKPQEAEMKVPMPLWPGFSTLTGLLRMADAHFGARQFLEAKAVAEQGLQNDVLKVFPEYSRFREIRTQSFEGFLTEAKSKVDSILRGTGTLKEKIAAVDASGPDFRFVADSISHSLFGIAPDNPTVVPIFARAGAELDRMSVVRDSLQNALDNQNVQWIIDGGATGRTGYLYQYMIEALAYAFSSVDFTDTSRTGLQCSISEDLRARLEKHTLTESYETFLRLSIERHKNGLSLFHPDFLPNLQRDTAAFPLPYYSILKAVHDYFDEQYETAEEEIFRVFTTCYDPEISARLDDMRVMIGIRRGFFPPEALRTMEEAAAAEAQGNR